MHRLKTVRSLLTWYGPFYLLRMIAVRWFSRILRIERLVFFTKELKGPPALVEPTAPVDIRVAGSDDMVRFRDQIARVCGETCEALRERVSHGNVALLAIAGGAVVGVYWLAFGAQPVAEIGATLLLNADEACGFNASVLPAWRGRNIFPALLSRALAFEWQRGIRRHVSWIRASNRPSLRVAEKSGRQPICTITSVSVGGSRPLVFGDRSTAAPRLQRDLRDAQPT